VKVSFASQCLSAVMLPRKIPKKPIANGGELTHRGAIPGRRQEK